MKLSVKAEVYDFTLTTTSVRIIEQSMCTDIFLLDITKGINLWSYSSLFMIFRS